MIKKITLVSLNLFIVAAAVMPTLSRSAKPFAQRTYSSWWNPKTAWAVGTAAVGIGAYLLKSWYYSRPTAQDKKWHKDLTEKLTTAKESADNILFQFGQNQFKRADLNCPVSYAQKWKYIASLYPETAQSYFTSLNPFKELDRRIIDVDRFGKRANTEQEYTHLDKSIDDVQEELLRKKTIGYQRISQLFPLGVSENVQVSPRTMNRGRHD